jgi:hypothetical protein
MVEAAPAPARLSPSERYARLGAGLQSCYQQALSRDPALAVDVLGHMVVRGDRVTYVDLDIPSAPELATCVAAVINECHPLSVHPSSSFSVASQHVRVDKQGRLPIAPAREEISSGFQRFLGRAVAAGALSREEVASLAPGVREPPLPPPPVPALPD